ncbi:oligosaccharide biosynthesis protein Alg14 [Aliiruegeria haliotis]|uniref:Oligosaccharide biosynthesis protein Alg14 n=1 Tax=Aliiruegeria haliotis TaxID=1280846 RepID=A0A2T0RFG1_9RHOB|nr:UDP-N-acetylglucosamine--LPS N-acetylglucosamine transferase [Aliiruegeria haliotis]PRY19840.1 oligosaccharide biosynthesis protein Alg14 [Aliiruegeria haliotis]
MTDTKAAPQASGEASSGRQTKKVLAIASAGGHWQQLMMLRPAFAHHDIHFATTLPGLAEEFGAEPATLIPDCNRNRKLEAATTAFAIVRLVRRVRPAIVISTGALPGVMALAAGRFWGARTIWVDSVANAKEMSMSGKQARRVADLWLTQWEDVAELSDAEFAGAVL